MQRLRTTFKRSRTPTGAEMKTQSSLEVPKQVRSASFDEIQLEAKRTQQLLQGVDNSGDGGGGGGFLKVPQYVNQRSKSFDSGGSAEQDVAATFLEVPVRRFQRRRSSSDKMPSACFHCICVEEYTRLRTAELADELLQLEEKRRAAQRTFSYSDDTSSSGEWEGEGEGEGGGDDTEGDREGENDADDDDESFEVSAITGADVEKGEIRRNLHSPCSIRVTLSPNSPSSPSEADCGTSGGEEVAMVMIQPPPTPGTPTLRRRSITSPKLSRQEAFVVVEPGSNSLENVSDVPSEGSESAASVCGGGGSVSDAPGLIVNDIYLKVPELKRDRAASVDSCFTKVSSSNKTEELDTTGSLLEPPAPQVVALRSRSVDIVLPTDEQARYKALAMATTATSSSVFGHSVKGYVRLVRYVRQHAALRTTGGKGKAVTPGENSEQRVLRSTPDWSETAINGEHLWAPTSASGDFCYVGEGDCTKHGPRMKCSACKIICHTNCINVLLDKTKFTCKPTFRDVGVRQYREQTSIHHHWVHRRSQKGKCKQCGKSFQSKLSFSSKEIVALSCSWCKTAYHNKESCFNLQKIGEDCNLGCHNGIIVPPSWIVKLPRRGSFKSSLRKSPKKKTASKKKSKEKNEKDQRTFVIKPIPSASVKPVIVFINPKSGGNQGVKLLQKFQWLLNPRQVFDLTQGGPRMGLEMFRKVPNLRVLACGGDGTVGWVLSILDQIGISPAPAVGVLPLGTGNDLARALGWGGGYTDEPISKILMNIGESDVVQLDRWELKVEKNPDVEANEEGKENLPLNVVNNYFSLGVDAHIALEFHEAREAHPERFNSRLRNKMFYGQAGGKDLVKRKWKGLAEFVTLECDGEDQTPKLKDHKVHAIVFLNIPSYGGGTHPWNRAGGSVEPATDDGLIEVVGLTTYQLPLLQAGGHGTCITQCKSARIVTTKTIPMQVDGEACKLMPSIITMSLLNKASMLAKRKGGKANVQQATLETMKVNVDCITMSNYEQYHYDKDVLQKTAVSLGEIEVNPVADLDQIRKIINKLMEEKLEDYNPEKGLPEWCFVDSCTAERFFRIDGAQEHLHYVTDIASDRLFVLNMGYRTNSPEDETACPSPSTSENKQISPQSMPEEETTGPELSYEASREDDESKWNAGENVFEGFQNSDHIEKSHGEEQHFDGEEERNSHNIQKLNLEHASPQGNINYLSQLLEKTTDGILKAAKLGDLNMLRNLHSQGYSLLSIDSNGQTALHYGSRYGHKDIVKYLIACAPPSILNMVDNDKGQTALHKAAAHKRRSICCMLVAGGASLKVCDHQGNTPLHLAISANDQELAAYLKSQEDFQLVSEDIETVV